MLSRESYKMPSKFIVGQSAVHIDDPLRRVALVVDVFKWLGRFKLQVQYENGAYSKDWEDYYETE